MLTSTVTRTTPHHKPTPAKAVTTTTKTTPTPTKAASAPVTSASYKPDGIHLSTDRRAEMAMVVTATGKPLGYKTPAQEANYLKSLEMSAPATSYDPKGFLASLGLWGLTGPGRGDDSIIEAVKATDYKPHTGTEKFEVPIPSFIMHGMVKGTPGYHAAQDIVDPLLSAYTDKRGLWKKPLVPAQTPKPTSQTPQARYPDAFKTEMSLTWGPDVHDGTKAKNDGYGTFQVAKSVGFSEAQAKRMSAMDIGVDTNKTPYGKTSPIVIGQMDRHFNFQRNGEDTRILWARQHLALAIEYGRKGAFNEAETELGVGMHSLQDLFAHAQIKPTVHATLGKFIDEPQWSPVSMVETTVATRNYLKAYLQGISSADGKYCIDAEPQN